MHEAQLHGCDNSFVTLTYRGVLSIAQRSLHYPDFQAFMHRLRKYQKRRAAARPSFYMCGEYGEQGQRPHFHALLFGVRFADCVYDRKGPSGEKLYRSADLEKLWPHGYSSIGAVTFESAAYVARYVVKKISGVRLVTGWHPYERACPDTGEIFEVEPEFNGMSLKPGIGARWLERFRSDVYPEGKVVARGKLGQAPRYYDVLQARVDPVAVEDLKFRRAEDARAWFADSSDERLSVKERVARARLFKRKIA